MIREIKWTLYGLARWLANALPGSTARRLRKEMAGLIDVCRGQEAAMRKEMAGWIDVCRGQEAAMRIQSSQTKGWMDMNDEVNKIGLWLRENKKAEIERGDHDGMSISQVVIHYLNRT